MSVKTQNELALASVKAIYDAANEAQAEAERAHSAADDAADAASAAQTSANNAQTSADNAATAASNAQTQATTATKHANAALDQLGVVEDVVGTLNWIATHATYKATTDTEVQAGKWYFTKSGDTYTVVTNPTGNPSSKGYYEVDSIDEAVSNYVASHLALTNDGLYLTKDGNGYKILLANDGLKIYDPAGHIVSTFGESITFDSARPQTIGNSNVYIKYYDKDNDGTADSLAIRADEFLLSGGSSILRERLELHTTYSGSNIVFSAAVIYGGEDVTAKCLDGDFMWYYRTPTGDELITNSDGTPKYGKTLTIPQDSQDYGRTVVCSYTRNGYFNLLTNTGNKLRMSTGTYLLGRSEY